MLVRVFKVSLFVSSLCGMSCSTGIEDVALEPLNIERKQKTNHVI